MLILFPSLACFVIVIVGMTSVSRLTLWIFAFSFQFSMFQCNFVCVLVFFCSFPLTLGLIFSSTVSYLWIFHFMQRTRFFFSSTEFALSFLCRYGTQVKILFYFFLLLLFLRGLTGKMHKNCNLKRNSMHGKHKTKLQNNIQHIRNWNCLFQ